MGEWTSERIARLARRDLTQLRENAAGLGHGKVVALCDQALASAPADPNHDLQRNLKASGVRLVSRRSAFAKPRSPSSSTVHFKRMAARVSWSGLRCAT